jgi:hypothetical protein
VIVARAPVGISAAADTAVAASLRLAYTYGTSAATNFTAPIPGGSWEAFVTAVEPALADGTAYLLVPPDQLDVCRGLVAAELRDLVRSW